MQDYTKLSHEEKEALVKKAMDVGFQTETDYGNCIQSCLNGLYAAFPDLGITEDMLQACFGIAGGCGSHTGRYLRGRKKPWRNGRG